MMKFEIPFVEEETYTNLPSFMLNCIEPWLDRNGVDYVTYCGNEIPEHLPQTYTFNGRTSAMCVCCIKSHMDSDALIKAAEAMLFMEKSTI